VINLNFRIDDTFLVSYILTNCSEDSFIHAAKEKYMDDIVNFQNLAWNKNKNVYNLITGKYYIYRAIESSSFQRAIQQSDEFIEGLIDTKEYKTLKTQTEESVFEIKKEWEKNYTETAEYIKNLGIAIEGTFEVFVVHPGLKSGEYMGNKKIIWSYRTNWENYNTVYLWHEILHSYFYNSDNTHALIELITDEEMRRRLNKEDYPPFVGHDHLTNLKNKGLDIWKSYLKEKNKDIKTLINNFELLENQE